MDEQDVVESLGASAAGGAGTGLITQSQSRAVRASFERGRRKKAIAREFGLGVTTVKNESRSQSSDRAVFVTPDVTKLVIRSESA